MKVFKNPNRGKNSHVNVEPYVPEYQRLDRQPITKPVSREEFRRPAPKYIAVPPQIKVNSGQNQEAGWMQALPDTTSQRTHPGLKPEVVQIKRSFVNNFYDEPLESQAMPDFSNASVENIRDEDIGLPPNPNQELEDDFNDESLNFSNLNVGEFVLIYDNDIIASGNEGDITSLLENILVSEEYNVVEEKLVIMKKMNFRTGVFISD